MNQTRTNNNDIQESYRLELADGVSWSFHTTPETHPWFQELARITRLRPYDAPTTRSLIVAPWIRGQAPRLPEAFGGETIGAVSGWEYFNVGTILRAWDHPERAETFVELAMEFIDHQEIRFIDMWYAMRLIFQETSKHGGGPIHSAFAELDGAGVIVAAAGDTGKSTCYRRFPSPWKPLSDDLALVVKQASDSAYIGHPFPTWSDYLWRASQNTWPCDYAVPIRGVFFLEQAPIDNVEPLSPNQAASRMFRSHKEAWGGYWSRLKGKTRRENAERVFSNAIDMAKVVPAYRLQATLHGNFWDHIAAVL
jgi:SynChlorMet cassette protein ScmC